MQRIIKLREFDGAEKAGDLQETKEAEGSLLCKLCSASFTSEFQLILHFHEEHTITSQDLSFLSDESESDLESDKEDETESRVEDEPDATEMNFLTDYERALLAKPVICPFSESEDEADTESEDDNDNSMELVKIPMLKSIQKKKEKHLSNAYELSKSKEQNLPNCSIIITRCDNLIPLGRSSGAVKHYGSDSDDRSGHDAVEKYFKEIKKSQSILPKNRIRKNVSLQQTADGQVSTQAGAKRHTCVFCLKSFRQRKVLNNHIRTHTGERPYQCRICSKSFGQLGNLNRHIRSHTGERPHQCHICSKSFGERGDLKRHIRSHTGNRHHQCHICSKSFTRREHLRRHIRTHKQELPNQ